MPSTVVTVPDLVVLEQVCSEHKISATGLFKLGWSLVVQQFLTAEVFQFQISGKGDASSALGCVGPRAIEKSTVSYGSGRVESTSIVESVQRCSEISLEGGDASPSATAEDQEISSPEQRFWSMLHIILAQKNQLGDVGLPPIINEINFGEPIVTMVIEVHCTRLKAYLSYNLDFLSEFGAKNMARSFGKSIESIIRNINGMVADISLLTDHDERQLKEWNTASTVGAEDLLHRLVEKSVRRYPNSTAIVSCEDSLTYMELDKLSSRLAHHLIDAFDVRPEVILPLCFEKSLWAPVTMLAVLKAGAAYTTLDPSHPQDRRESILNTIDAKLVITSHLHAGRFSSCQSLVVDADLLTHLAELGTPDHSPSTSVKSSNAAIVGFTSGSTGTPKCFVHEHISMCSGILANGLLLGLNHWSRVFQFTSYSFDVSITEMFGTWVHGGCVCIPSDEERLNQVAESMNRMGVNWTFFTPSFSRFIRQARIPSLETILLGGEVVTVDDVNDWASKGVRVLQAFSPAETSSWYIADLVASVRSHNAITLGRIRNALTWIVNPEDDQKLMPVGAVGELVFEGPCLIREYLKIPERNTKSFVEAPGWRSHFGPSQYPRFYKTGDLVQLRPDGMMSFIGRKDTQVKLRGQRLELGEVEHLLRQNLPPSAQSAVEIVITTGKSQMLVAFLAFGDGTAHMFDMNKVQEHFTAQLLKSLPQYMIPQEFILLPAIPYMHSGKVDRQKLKRDGARLLSEKLQPEVSIQHDVPKQLDVPIQIGVLTPPDTPTEDKGPDSSTKETTMRDLWAQALHFNAESIKVDDDFFALGGSSTDASKLVAAAKDKGIGLTLVDIFQYPTLRALAIRLSSSSAAEPQQLNTPFTLLEPQKQDRILADAQTQCQVPESKIQDIYPCTPQQEGVWALSLIEPGKHVCQFVINLAADVDMHRLRTAIESVVKAEPILRTRIIQSGSRSYQVVVEESVRWMVVSNLTDYLKQDGSIPLDLGERLSRYAILSQTDSRTLVWTMHHALTDTRSHQLILEAVAQEYWGTTSQGRAGVPFNLFIEKLQNNDDDDSHSFWRTKFGGLQMQHFPSLPSPHYRPHPAASSFASIKIARIFRSRTTTPTIIRAAWALTVGQHIKTQDVFFGVTLAGTSSAMVGSVMGPTFVTVPIRVALKPQKSVSHLLETIQNEGAEMIEYEHTGIQNIMALSRECQVACQFQSLLVIQQQNKYVFDGLFEWHEASRGLDKFNSHAIMWECTMNGDKVNLHANYDEAIIGREEVQKLITNFENFVHLLSLEEEDRLLLSIANLGAVEPEACAPCQQQTFEPKAIVEEDSLVLKMLHQIWSETLHLDDQSVTPEDDFFSSGGNSITAMAMVANARAIGVNFTVADVFRNPSLRLLARAAKIASQKTIKIEPFSLLGSSGAQTEIRKTVAIQNGVDVEEIEDIYPCTPMQEALMALSQSTPGAYIAQYVLDFDETLHEDEIRDLWNKVVASFPILRTRIIRAHDSTSLQAVLSKEASWQIVSDLDDYLKEDRQMPMDYGAPLCRFLRVKRTAGHRPHRVVWTLHHALYDGVVNHMILDTVKAFHQKIAPPAIATFERFIKYLGENDQVAAKSYWQSQLQQRSSSIFPRLPTATYKPSANSITKTQIKFARGPGSTITESALLRAAWALLISQYSGSDDVLFGVTLSGRSAPVPSIDKVAGPTITTVPVRIRVDPGKSLADWLKVVQSQATDMIPFEHTGLSKITSFCPGASDFQNLLVVHTSPDVIETKDALVNITEASDDWAYFNSYALMWSCTINCDGAEVTASFDNTVMDKKQVHRLVKHFEYLIQCLCREPNAPVSSLLHISPSDFAELKEWNKNFPQEHKICVHDLIGPGFLRDPQKSAVEAWDGSFSYEDLQRKSSNLAHYVAEQGVGPEVIVPLCFEKSKWAVVAAVAVLKAGGAYFFIDPAHGATRRQAILRKVNARVILTTTMHSELFGTGRDVTIVDTALLSKLDDTSLQTYRRSRVQPSNTAYIVFTSGSTGTPKGIVHTHTSLSSSILNHAPHLGIDVSSRVFQWSAFTYDGIVSEIFATLMHGGCICIPHESERLANASDYINRAQVTWATITPSFGRIIRGKGSGKETEVPSLKTLVVGGEPITSYDVQEWAPRLQLKQCLGATETEGWVLGTHGPDSREPNDGRGVGVLPWIMNEKLQLLPIGAIGEIVYQGPSIATGYLDDEVKTSKAFVEAPAWLPHAEQGRRLYKTGDMGYWKSDGTLKILGRIDLQVKLHGQRLELSEVEFHMKRHLPSSADAAAEIVKPDGEGTSHMLVGFVCLPPEPHQANGTLASSGADDHLHPLFEKLRSQLLESLPYYMVPSTFISYGAFPINFNGKLDRALLRHYAATLPLLEIMKFNGGNSDRLWRSLRDDEHVALQINQKVVDMVGANDAAYANTIIGRDVILAHTGLDSIKMISLATFVARTFKVKIAVSKYMGQGVSVSDIVRFIAEARTVEQRHMVADRVDIMAEFCVLDAQLQSLQIAKQIENERDPAEVETVFLTGATGFLGSQILYQLLSRPHIRKVVALVRARDSKHATERVVQAARTARWWSPRMRSRLEAWVGDLAKPKLGLSQQQWDRLSGSASVNEERVDAIIHNGAVVHWDSNFQSLRAANVLSTVDILSLLGQTSSELRFCYISGGEMGVNEDDDKKIAESLATAGGYAQTKFVSEMLVKSFAARYEGIKQRISIVKPAWILGSEATGVANTDDFLWRLVASAVRVNAFNSDDGDAWLAIAGVDHVAAAVIEHSFGSDKKEDVMLKMLDGITTKEFWETVKEALGANLCPLSSADWLEVMRQDISSAGEKHPLWPVMHWLEMFGGGVGDKTPTSSVRQKKRVNKEAVVAAVQRSIDYLDCVGYLDLNDDNAEGPSRTGEAVFSRSVAPVY